jgi:type II secretory pathway pseudopilin PulG
MREGNMRTIFAFVICIAIASSVLSQSTSDAGRSSAQTSQQEKEQQLRTALQEMRDAIDHYHGMFIRGKIMAKMGSQGYPPDLETLVKGAVDAHGQPPSDESRRSILPNSLRPGFFADSMSINSRCTLNPRVRATWRNIAITH